MTSEIESNFLFQGTRQPWILATRVAVAGNRILESSPQGRDPFNQNFRNISVQNSMDRFGPTGKVSKKGATFLGGPIFPVGPVGILVEWIAPQYSGLNRQVHAGFISVIKVIGW